MKSLIILLIIISNGHAYRLTAADVAYVQTKHQHSFNTAMAQNTVIRNTDVGDNILKVLEGRGK
jgi:hypothetical protein